MSEVNAMNAVSILTTLRKGGAAKEMTDEINRATKRAIETGKAATVTLTITIKPSSVEAAKLIDPPMLLTAKVATKLPELPAEPTLLFGSENGLSSAQAPVARDQGTLQLSVSNGR
jgi:hypothetical protein